MNVLKLERGRVKIYRTNGVYLRYIGRDNAVSADFNQDQSLVAITYLNGKVEIYRDNGVYLRQIGHGDAVQARWAGNEIMITRKNGRVELYRDNGSYIRSI